MLISKPVCVTGSARPNRKPRVTVGLAPASTDPEIAGAACAAMAVIPAKARASPETLNPTLFLGSPLIIILSYSFLRWGTFSPARVSGGGFQLEAALTQKS